MKRLSGLIVVLCVITAGQSYAANNKCVVGTEREAGSGRYTFYCDPIHPTTANPKKLPAGQIGLEAAAKDESAGIGWCDTLCIVTGAADTEVGTGRANTNKIVETLSAGNYAAKICDDSKQGGYNDWFLPSKDELNLMFLANERTNAGNAQPDKYYWSSSEESISDGTSYLFAWAQKSSNGFQILDNKPYVGSPVRCIRVF